VGGQARPRRRWVTVEHAAAGCNRVVTSKRCGERPLTAVSQSKYKVMSLQVRVRPKANM
jgi:hypothetical protein